MKKLFSEVAIGARFSLRKKDWVGHFLKIKATSAISRDVQRTVAASDWCLSDYREQNSVILSNPLIGELTYVRATTEVEVED